MKWSLIAGLFTAPLALAGTLQADLVARTNGNGDGKGGGMEQKGNNGGSTVIIQEIIIIWVNNGGGAQTTTMNAMASAATPNGAAQTHTVIVGGAAGLVYTPESINAAIGDMVVFTFMSNNHTATQSAFTTPCDVLPGGMDTGFMPNPNNTVNPPPQMAMQVKVSTPIWFFCGQKGHCGKGMVFSINPTANKTQAMFKEMAIQQKGSGTTAGIIATGAPANTATAAAASSTDSAAAAAVQTAASGSGSSGSSSGSSGSGQGTMVQGSGVTGSGSSCSCSCLCAVANFPAAVQGLENFGGMSGSMPMAMMKS